VRSEGLYSELAAAILDGAPIDWAAAEASSSDAERPVLGRLKALAAIVELHRGPALYVAESENARRTVLPAERWGHLRLIERLGGGSFGEVYRAWDERLDREVALKLLAGAAQAAPLEIGSTIIEEGRLLARVRHPNVVTIHGGDVIDDRIGLWMELVSGQTLERVVAEGKRFTAAETVALGIDLCNAVAAVHAAGLLHRDIKASNVMVAGDGRVVLMDFGTGRELEDATVSLAGTPLYLAPELFAGGKPSAASDVYSVGVLLYHLLTGSYPVRAADAAGLRLAHLRGERARLQFERPDLPARLVRAIDRALDHDADRRSTLDALAAELAAVSRASRGARRRRRVSIAAAIVLALGAGWEILGRRGGATPPSRIAGNLGLLFGSVPSAPIAEPTIVVLPFDDLDGVPGGDSFAEGLADEIIHDLARVEGLAVRSRYSSFTFRGQPRNLIEVGRRLGANLAVTGSVLRSGDRLRVNAQLVDLTRDRPLWTERFDRGLQSSADVFAVVDEIALSIVNELRLTLGTGQRRYDVDLDLYDRYLAARSLVGRRGSAEPTAAVVQLERILNEDPTFAPAYAALADAYAFLSMIANSSSVSPARGQELMRAAAVRAIELDPLLAEAHAAMGVVYSRARDWQRAEQSFERALDLDSTLTEVYTNYSFAVLRPLGKSQEALRLLAKALENDPLSLDVEREIAEIDCTDGRYQEAIDRLERISAVDPELPFVSQFLARALIFGGRPSEGLAVLEQDVALGRPQPHYRSHALMRLGRRQEVDQLAAAAVRAGRPYHETIIYAALGDLDRAFEALDRAAVAEPQRIPIALTYPELAVLRGDPRLAAFRQRFGLP
jgi:serine/threonine-protein kinase